MKTGRGWWALVGVVAGSVAFLLAGYVGAYYSLVKWERWTIDVTSPENEWEEPLQRGEARAGYPYWTRRVLPVSPERFFWPIHQIDRSLRPQFWAPPPP